MFTKGATVVRVIKTEHTETAADQVIANVKKGVVTLVDSCCKYNEINGEEIDPAIPGCSSRIIEKEV